MSRNWGGELLLEATRGEAKVLVGERGELLLSDELRRRWGLAPGVAFVAQETPEGLLLRRSDPLLTKVYVEPTSDCNLRCRTCVRNSWSEPTGTMGMATYRRLVDGLRAAPSLRAVSFWGFGEPLLHPHVVEMVALASELGVRTEVITNGLLLDRKMAEGLVAAGLDTLVVSVDGTSPETHADIRSGADLRLVQRNVEGLQEARDASPRGKPEVGLEFVAMRRNVGDLPNLPRLARSMGASFVVVTNVLPYTEELRDEVLYGLWAGRSYPAARSIWSPEIVLPWMDVCREARGPLLELLETTGVAGPALRYTSGAAGYRRFVGDLWHSNGTAGYCRFVGEGTAAIGWDGEVSPCVALMHSYTCYVLGREKRIRRYALGNVGREDITRIWNRQEYARFRALVQAFDFAPCTDCGSCELAETNEEDCFGNMFPVCGDCLWAKGVIQCP